MRENNTENANELQVLYEDNHLIAINKQTGVLVQPDNKESFSVETSVKKYLEKKYNKPGSAFTGVVHRLDRPVSGIVLLTKTGKALSRINKMLQEREITKIYWAVTSEKPEPEKGKLVHFITRNEKKNISYAQEKETRGGKLAELKYSVIAESEFYFLTEIELITGRHHQIRAQFSAAGFPIRGDLKYGAKRSNPNGGISLHFRKISFVHPVKGEQVEITAPVPEEKLWKFFEEKLPS